MSPPAKYAWKEVGVLIQDFSEPFEEVSRAVEDRKDGVSELALQWIGCSFKDCSGKEATMKVHDSRLAAQLEGFQS
jgi:hypothetical protein